MARAGVDAVIVTGPADLRYLCGFSGSNGMVLLFLREGYFLTDFRYREQSALEVVGMRRVVYEDDPGGPLGEIVSRRARVAGVTSQGASGEEPERDGNVGKKRPGIPRIGYDPETLTCAELSNLKKSLRGKASLVSLRSGFQPLRAVKSVAEVVAIKEGLRMAEEAFREALRRAETGMTEWDLALEVDFAARRMGAEGLPFETIVASGKRGALVHASPSRRRLSGAVVVDWGVIHRGYCTDCTRTLAWGRVPAELKRAHRAVLEAQERALERVKPGARAREVDRAAREVLERAGFGEAFGHGLGHGVGLEVHERPHVGPRSEDVLREGMVFTVEPGVYLPGLGGVRVEDMVLVTAGGVEVLSGLPRSLDPSDY